VRRSVWEECHGMVWWENIDSGYPNFQWILILAALVAVWIIYSFVAH
jgi:hypothetical protein